MNTNAKDKLLMDYLDGISKAALDNPELKEEGQSLFKLQADLKTLPLQHVDETTDKRMRAFISKRANGNTSVIRKYWPALAVAASIVLVVLNINTETNLEAEYLSYTTNPQKLGFIYELNNKELDVETIDWLKREMQKDIHPNIKVTIIDLLNNYQSKLDKDFYAHLKNETIPSVQMALLNIIESTTHINVSNELSSIAERKDLDQTVRQKINDILSNQY